MPLGLQHREQHNNQGNQVFFAHGERLGGEDALDSVVTTSEGKTLQGVGQRHRRHKVASLSARGLLDARVPASDPDCA